MLNIFMFISVQNKIKNLYRDIFLNFILFKVSIMIVKLFHHVVLHKFAKSSNFPDSILLIQNFVDSYSFHMERFQA